LRISTSVDTVLFLLPVLRTRQKRGGHLGTMLNRDSFLLATSRLQLAEQRMNSYLRVTRGRRVVWETRQGTLGQPAMEVMDAPD
jgi:hypothetical protein